MKDQLDREAVRGQQAKDISEYERIHSYIDMSDMIMDQIKAIESETEESKYNELVDGLIEMNKFFFIVARKYNL